MLNKKITKKIENNSGYKDFSESEREQIIVDYLSKYKKEYENPQINVLKKFTPFISGTSLYTDKAKVSIIQGHSLYTTSILSQTHKNSVKVIISNPPFNNGRDCFYGKELITNDDPNKRSKFLAEMSPIFTQSREMLTNDGALIIICDENEMTTWRNLLDKIYGKDNFVASLIKNKGSHAGKTATNYAKNHEYVLIYAKNIENFKLKGIVRQDDSYSNPDKDPRGPWRKIPISAAKPGGDVYYPITNPATGKKVFPRKGRFWTYNSSKMNELILKKEIFFEGKNVFRKIYQLENIKESKVISSFIDDYCEERASNSSGTKDLSNLIGKNTFPNPKAVNFFYFLIDQVLNDSKDGIVIDLFSGSGTTAQAVLEYNNKNNAKINCILGEINKSYTSIIEKRMKALQSLFPFSFNKWEIKLRKKENTILSEIEKTSIEVCEWIKDTLEVKSVEVNADHEIWTNHQSEAILFQKESLIKDDISRIKFKLYLCPLTKEDIDPSVVFETAQFMGEQISAGIENIKRAA